MSHEGSVCPKCGAEGKNGADHQIHIRQSEGEFLGMHAHFVGVGWKCWSCGHEWGFDEEEDGQPV